MLLLSYQLRKPKISEKVFSYTSTTRVMSHNIAQLASKITLIEGVLILHLVWTNSRPHVEVLKNSCMYLELGHRGASDSFLIRLNSPGRLVLTIHPGFPIYIQGFLNIISWYKALYIKIYIGLSHPRKKMINQTWSMIFSNRFWIIFHFLKTFSGSTMKPYFCCN